MQVQLLHYTAIVDHLIPNYTEIRLISEMKHADEQADQRQTRNHTSVNLVTVIQRTYWNPSGRSGNFTVLS